MSTEPKMLYFSFWISFNLFMCSKKSICSHSKCIINLFDFCFQLITIIICTKYNTKSSHSIYFNHLYISVLLFQHVFIWQLTMKKLFLFCFVWNVPKGFLQHYDIIIIIIHCKQQKHIIQCMGMWILSGCFSVK